MADGVDVADVALQRLHPDVDVGEPVIAPAAESDEREAALLRVDSSRARERLAWIPTWDLAASIDATVEWYAGHSRRADARTVTLEQIERFGKGAVQAA